MDAVAAMNRDSMVAASNAWGLAHQAWMADLDNAVLESKLNDAIAAQEEACAPLYEAEDLYNQIPEAERSDDRVQDAYAVWAAILAATYAAMENPVATGAGGEPDLGEITEMLYDDLPDAPTGNYLGRYGLPVATGDTKIGLSLWTESLLTDESTGRMDAEALNADGLSVTVPVEGGEDYAIVPIMIQVEYPANNSATQVILPDDVTLLALDRQGDLTTPRVGARPRKRSCHARDTELHQPVYDQETKRKPDGGRREQNLLRDASNRAAQADRRQARCARQRETDFRGRSPRKAATIGASRN